MTALTVRPEGRGVFQDASPRRGAGVSTPEYWAMTAIAAQTSALDEVEQYLPHLDQRNPNVSGWCVGEQLHHALLSADVIARLVVESTAGARRPSFSPIRWIVLTTGKIPRGRAQAPKRVRPSENVSREELEQLLVQARATLASAEAADPAAWYEHFIFGVMGRNAAIRLIHVHTRHHLAIVKDILA